MVKPGYLNKRATNVRENSFFFERQIFLCCKKHLEAAFYCSKSIDILSKPNVTHYDVISVTNNSMIKMHNIQFLKVVLLNCTPG